MTQNSEGISITVNGTVTAIGLPKLLGALWRLDIHKAPDLEKLKTKFRYAMDERGGQILLETGAVLRVTRAAFTVMGKKKRPTAYFVTGSLEEPDLDLVCNAGIETHWSPSEQDELDSFLSIDIRDLDGDASRVSIHPSSAPPSRSK